MSILSGVQNTVFRHGFFMLGIVALAASLALVGRMAMQSTEHLHILSSWLETHEVSLFLWRCALYLVVFFSWKPYLNYRYKNCEKITSEVTHKRLLGFRSWLVVAMVAYEVILVNNVLAYFIGKM